MSGRQHAGLTATSWARFDRDRQLLKLAAEMSRATTALVRGDLTATRNCYERVLAMAELTIGGTPGRSLRRELLRWRDLVAELFVANSPDPALHDAVHRALLLLVPATFAQLPFARGASRPLLAERPPVQ